MRPEIEMHALFLRQGLEHADRVPDDVGQIAYRALRPAPTREVQQLTNDLRHPVDCSAMTEAPSAASLPVTSPLAINLA